MALSDSNTYVLPSQSIAVAISRSQFNSSLRAVLQNFYSPATPDADNFVQEGASLSATEYDGALYRDSTTGVLYIHDTNVSPASGRTNNPQGGFWTRYGIAWRQQGSLAAAATNISDFDIGEAFVVVKDTAGSANNRMYLRVATSGTFNNDFIDVGTPFPGSISTSIIQDGAVTGAKLAPTMNAPSLRTLTPRFVINSLANNQTTATTAGLEVTSTTSLDLAIGFNNSADGKLNTLKQIPGNTPTTRGLGVYTTANALAPIRANLVMQSEIFGSTSETAAVLIPAGIVVAWAGSSAPDGWLECNGAAISRTTYATLFAIAGTAFGPGNGSTTFNIPDVRGRAIYGTSTAITRGVSSTAASSGITKSGTTGAGGSASHTLTTTSVNSTSDKDVAATVDVVTAVAAHPTHTHSFSVEYPGISMMYIIKT